YPLFLYVTLMVTRRFLGVLFVQHLLALATGAAAAAMFYCYFSASRVGAALVFFLSASLPLPAVYAHHILTETLYTFYVLAAVGFILAGHGTGRWEWWSAAGVAVALGALTRPAGRAFLGVVAVAPFLEHLKIRRWRGLLGGLGTACGILLAAALWNA